MTKNLEDIGEVAHHGPEDLLIALLTFLGAFALMLLVSPGLALLTLLVVPAVGWVVAHYGGRMTQNWQAQFGRVGAFNARIEEAVGGIRVVKAFANEAHERGLFAEDNARYQRTKLDAYRLMAVSQTLNYLGMRLVQVVVMLAGSIMIVGGTLSVGDFVAFLLLVGVFYRPLDKIGAVIETYPRGIAGFRSYLDLLATEPDIVDRPGARAVTALRGEVRFEGVTFGYTAGEARCCATSTCPSRPGAPSRWWVPPAPARPPSAPCCRASTRSRPGASPSTASTSAT